MDDSLGSDGKPILPPSALLGDLSLSSGRTSGKAKCEKDWNWKPYPLPDYDLWYVASGAGTIRIQSVDYPIVPGSCFLLRPGDAIFAQQHPDQRLTVLFVHFRAERSSAAAAGVNPVNSAERHEALEKLPRCSVIQDTVWFESLLNRLLTLDEEERSPAIEAEFEAVLKAALCLVLRECSADRPQAGSRHPAVRQAIRLMKENVAAPFSHAELGGLTGISPRYLNVLFKEQTGYSVRNYLARVRIDRACQLLSESTMNVSQIAETLGYADIYFFSKQFKQFIGESPTRYRSRSHEARSH
ncbi:helix-turn-helix domain-containing protein [Cohnella boryungensis]|uniref:Helix-turn-helix domain-containing protein n=1 Tax=Cohnella boryungensis TaxID=768479 RepID=A0ABV8SBJ7_9BACL